MKDFNFNRFNKFALGILVILNCLCIVGFLNYNQVRGDEFLSFLHSSPTWNSVFTVIKNIYQGVDNSYTHASFLYFAFQFLGYSILVQRMVSLCFILAGSVLLYKCIGLFLNEKWQAVFITASIVFSNTGIFLATDGRFYALLFCTALAQVYSYFNKQKWPTIYFLFLQGSILLFGLLCSINFAVFETVFVLAIVISTFLKRNTLKDKIPLLVVLSVVGFIYFNYFKVNYFYHFFASALTRPHTLSANAIVDYISIFPRWFMLPHFFITTIELDFALTMIGIIMLVLFKFNSIKVQALKLPIELWIMAILVVAIFPIQLLLYYFAGYPLWLARYFSAVYFLPILLVAMLVVPQLSNKVTAVVILLCIVKVVFVDVKKLDHRRAETNLLHQKIQHITWPSKFNLIVESDSENELVAVGEVYILLPKTRDILYFSSNPKNAERLFYFNRLQQLHYPFHIVDAADSMQYSSINVADISIPK